MSSPKKSSSPPRIGITLFSRREGHKVYAKVQYNYVRSVLDAGGAPILIPTVADTNAVGPFLDTIDGLLLTGGEDIAPLVYNADPRPELGPTNMERDEWEIALLRGAEDRRMPVLGICRGIHVMNVARGGDLIQDIQGETRSAIGHAPIRNPMESLHHTIRMEPDSLISTILSGGNAIVNSCHHQAIKTLGNRLRVTATANDGIVEAIEDDRLPFYLGVQYHAEALPPIDQRYLTIFTALIDAATVFRDR